MKKIIGFLMIFLSTTSLSFCAQVYYTGKEKVTVTGTLESKNSFISYVTINEKEYIVKQKRDLAKQGLAAMREALAAHIAHDLAIAHSVQIVPAKDNMSGKAYQGYPATLHTRALGKMVNKFKEHKYSLLCLKQRDRDYGREKVTGRWLTETIVQQITWHKQLAIIIALDLFIGNTDRNSRNLFYDEESDSFCAIDMENIYKRDVAAFACEKLDEMVRARRKQFTPEEIDALLLVKNTLEFLLKKYSPQNIMAQFDKYAQQVGFVYDGSHINNKMIKKMNRNKKMIIQSHASARRLVVMLGQIIRGTYQ